jgi:hypothetical protein
VTRQIRSEVEHRVLKAYAAGQDLHRIAEALDVPHGRVSLIVQDIARFNRAGARTLVAEWERLAGTPAPLRRVSPPVLAPPRAAPPAPPAVVVEPEPEPEPPAEPDPAPGWDGWLCWVTGRRYRDPGPHGAPKRCSCKPLPIVVGGAS